MLKRSLLKYVLVSAFIFPAIAHADENKIEANRLMVTGEALLYKPADQVVLNLGVLTEDVAAGKSLSLNSTAMQSVLAAINSSGLDKSEFQTGRFTIQPIYSTPPRDPPPDWQAKITGYRTSNMVTIKTSKLDLVGKLIDSATKAGANSIGDIVFNLSDPQKYRSEAIQAAAKNAISDAKALADAAGLKLEKVIRIELDPVVPPQPMYKTGYSLRSASFDNSSPIESGDVEVKARVAVVYEI